MGDRIIICEVIMEKESTVIKFYVLCNKLKDIIRTGWKDWGVKRKRVESIAGAYLWYSNVSYCHVVRI